MLQIVDNIANENACYKCNELLAELMIPDRVASVGVYECVRFLNLPFSWRMVGGMYPGRDAGQQTSLPR